MEKPGHKSPKRGQKPSETIILLDDTKGSLRLNGAIHTKKNALLWYDAFHLLQKLFLSRPSTLPKLSIKWYNLLKGEMLICRSIT